jgi:hypothetical protein
MPSTPATHQHNTSTQHINTMSSTRQPSHQHVNLVINTPTHQHINLLHISTSTHQPSTYQRVQHISTSTIDVSTCSTHQHINTMSPTHQHINSSTHPPYRINVLNTSTQLSPAVKQFSSYGKIPCQKQKVHETFKSSNCNRAHGNLGPNALELEIWVWLHLLKKFGKIYFVFMAFGKRLIDWLFHDNSNQLQKSNSSNA